MRVVTWNLLTDAVPAAPAWAERCPRVAARITALEPAVIGTQEASSAMLDDLVTALRGRYRWVGEGRRGGMTDETCGIVYDPTALTVLDVRHRWLSDTPEVPGSQAEDAHLPRMLTAVRFHDPRSGRSGMSGTSFTVVNTHLDHVGEQARVTGARLVAQEARATGAGPAVVLGDFNDGAGSPAYDVLVDSGLRDALEPRDRPERRLRSFVGVDQDQTGEGEQIDWLLVTPDLTVSEAWVDAGPEDAPLASDHRPLVADLDLG